MAHSDATLTFPQTVYLRYAFQEIGVADNAAEGYKRWFVARLKLLEKTLEEKEYLCSNRLTLADICVGYAIYLAKCLNIEKAFKPNIVRWTNMLFEREAFKKAISLKSDFAEAHRNLSAVKGYTLGDKHFHQVKECYKREDLSEEFF